MTITDLKNYKYLKRQKALLESEKAELILKSNPPDNSKSKTNKTSDTVAQTVENREELQADIDISTHTPHARRDLLVAPP